MEINKDNNITTKLFSITKNLTNKNLNNNAENNLQENISNKIKQNISEFNLTNEENLKLILSTIGISSSEKNMSLVNLLLNSSITINKENLTNASLNLKLFNELPFEKLEVLLKNNIDLNISNANQLEKYISQKINLTSQLEELFSNINDNELLSDILNCFTNNKELLNLSKEISNKLDNIKSQLVFNLKNNLNSFDNILKSIKQILNENPNLIKQSPILNTIFENFKNIDELKNLFNNNELNNNFINKLNENELKNVVDNIIDSILPSKILFNKDSINYFEKTLRQTFSNKLNQNQNNNILNLEKEIFKNIFKNFNIKEFKEFIPKNLNFQSKLNKEICFDFKNSNSEELNIFLNNIKQNVELTKSMLKENNINNDNIVNKNLENISKNLDFLGQLKNTSLIQIPLNINNEKTNADLFIFKDKKNNNKNKNSNSGSVLLSLNLSNLGLIETYINKIENNIYCQFRIQDNQISKLIKNNLNLLNFYLKEKNLILKEVNFKQIDEKFSLISKEPNKNFSPIPFENFNIQA